MFLRERKRYLDGGNEHGGTDEEGEGKAAVFDRFCFVYVCERIWRQHYLELF